MTTMDLTLPSNRSPRDVYVATNDVDGGMTYPVTATGIDVLHPTIFIAS